MQQKNNFKANYNDVIYTYMLAVNGNHAALSEKSLP